MKEKALDVMNETCEKLSLIFYLCTVVIGFAEPQILRSGESTIAVFKQTLISDKIINELKINSEVDQLFLGFNLESSNFGTKDIDKLATIYPNLTSVTFSVENLRTEHLLFLANLPKLEHVVFENPARNPSVEKPFNGIEELDSVEAFILSKCNRLKQVVSRYPVGKNFSLKLRRDQILHE